MDQTVMGQDQMPIKEADASLAFFEMDETFIPSPESINTYEVGRSFYQLGKIYYDKADLNKAEENFLKAIKCTEKPRDTFSIFKILGFLIRIASEKLED